MVSDIKKKNQNQKKIKSEFEFEIENWKLKNIFYFFEKSEFFEIFKPILQNILVSVLTTP
jgi:hypothetical protein